MGTVDGFLVALSNAAYTLSEGYVLVRQSSCTGAYKWGLGDTP